MAQLEKSEDKQLSRSTCETVVLTMDLQAVLLAPVLNASTLYYKTKLTCHNFTLFDLNSNQGTCYFWDESHGGLEADSFASCIIDYLETHESCKKASTIILYSDGCTYQNRNVVLSNALLDFSNKARKTVYQKILEKGHTQMECDSIHAVCERAIKQQKIYVPLNYVELIKHAKRDKPYNVKHITYEFFKTYSSLTYYDSIRPGKNPGDPVVTDLRQLKYADGQIMYKTCHRTDQEKQNDKVPSADSGFSFLPRRVRKNTGTVKQKYLERQKFKESKFQHLQQLKLVMDKEYHLFYDQIPH